MPNDADPLIRLEPGGTAPVLSYNLPEPAIYFGRNFIELEYDDDVFTDAAFEEPEPDEPIVRPQPVPIDGGDAEEEVAEPVEDEAVDGEQEAERSRRRRVRDHRERSRRRRSNRVRTAGEQLSQAELAAAVGQEMRTGFSDSRIFPNVRLPSGSIRLVERDGTLDVVSSLPVSEQVAKLDAQEVATRKRSGQELHFYTSLFGTIRYKYVPKPKAVEPRLLLVETYRLATYLGSYGAGPVVQTFSLLPGERTTIKVRTFRKSEEERKQASSILDSFTEESATDFEETIASEQSDRSTYEKSSEYHVEADAKASWGWGKASVRGGVKGGTNAAREESSKNTTNATNKHAQKASAKRQVEVDTSFEQRETEEEERSTERQIENINLSRTLNYVFRQMNQEFITVLSLVDVRIAFFNGHHESRQEVSLPELDALLSAYVEEGERDQVRADVEAALGGILDHEGRLHDDFIEHREIDADNRYLRVRTEKTSTYRDPVTGTEIDVPGIILSTTKNVMRTDGVMVEALLGLGGALDEYAENLQQLEVERRAAELAGRRADLELAELANAALRDNDAERAELVEAVAAHRAQRRQQEPSGDDDGTDQP